MFTRLDLFKVAPEAAAILIEQETNLKRQFSAEDKLTQVIWELVKLRVSQINQCAYCVDMHTKDALSEGIAPELLYNLSVWPEMPSYSQQEKAALSWAELITSGEAIADVAFNTAAEHFGERGLAVLTIAINAINSWNRISKAFKPVVGSYTAES